MAVTSRSPLPPVPLPLLLVLLVLVAILPLPARAADRVLRTSSLNACQRNSGFRASLFRAAFTPGNSTVDALVSAVSSIESRVVFDVTVAAYGLPVDRRVIDPCVAFNRTAFCPMTAGKFTLPLALGPADLGDGLDAGGVVPALAYAVPDLDASVRAYINRSDTGEPLACLDAAVSNGRTVSLAGVKWTTAVLAGAGLVASALVGGLGHANAAAHLAANALSVFAYFQAQAMLGLAAVHLPPIVQAWTQNFQWSMGIIRLASMQDALTWYQRATGGRAASIFDDLRTVSVQVLRRRQLAVDSSPSASDASSSELSAAPVNESGSYVVRGITRVAFRAGIEATNLFMTGLIFFCLFGLALVVAVVAVRVAVELVARRRRRRAEAAAASSPPGSSLLAPPAAPPPLSRVADFRLGWAVVLRGLMLRVCLIGFPQMAILCLWELTRRDSPAEVALAVGFLLAMTAMLAVSALAIVRIARRSQNLHGNAAYVLYAETGLLNKLGFLYVQYRATAYYFIIPALIYVLAKAMLIALAQDADTAQAVGLMVIEALYLVAASVLRPWMDKSTNTFNIAVCAVNFINTIFLFLFCNVLDLPGIVVGVVGVVFFVVNAVFSLILLVIVIVSTAAAFLRKNPDAHYHAMGDDRASFMKSSARLVSSTELDSLAATARGQGHGRPSDA